VLRKGFPEVIWGEGKTPVEILSIIKQLKKRGQNILITRLEREKSRPIRKAFPKSQYYPRSRVLTYHTHPVKNEGKGVILVITAGTTDIPVAEEAAITAQFMGNRVETLYDVGVAGIHRLLSEREKLETARVLIVVGAWRGRCPWVGGLVTAGHCSPHVGMGPLGDCRTLTMLNLCLRWQWSTLIMIRASYVMSDESNVILEEDGGILNLSILEKTAHSFLKSLWIKEC
jgi:NCAIR mutase (PurE)-related protein